MVRPHPPLLQRLPLAFHDHRAVLDHRIECLAERLKRSLPVADLQAAAGPAAFVHRSSCVQVGGMAITAAAHSPLMGRTHEQSRAVFTMALYGEKQFHLEGGMVVCRAGHTSLFLPGEAYRVESGLCSGVMFTVDRARLESVARAMVGAPGDAPVLTPASLEAPHAFAEQDPLQGRLLGLVRRSLLLIDRCGADCQGQPASAQCLDDVIHRALVLLLQPELHRSAWDRGSDRQADGFDRLVAAVRHDPGRLWSLSEMERFSGLGREGLRSCVRQAFGCSPLAWLARERGHWARRRSSGHPCR